MRAYVLTLTRVLQYRTACSPARITHGCLSESCLAFRFKCPIHPSSVTAQLTTQGESPSPVSSDPSRVSPFAEGRRPGLAGGCRTVLPCAEPQGAGSCQPRSSARRTASRRGRAAFPNSVRPTISLPNKGLEAGSQKKKKTLLPINAPAPLPSAARGPSSLRLALSAGLAIGC